MAEQPREVIFMELVRFATGFHRLEQSQSDLFPGDGRATAGFHVELAAKFNEKLAVLHERSPPR